MSEAARELHRSGVPDPEVSATRIGQRATGTDGLEWLEVVDRDATKRQVASFDAMVARRRVGEPLQYVVGGWGFRTLELFLDQRVLIPRPETEVVAGVALAELKRLGDGADRQDRPMVVADLGTGSGAIGLALAAEGGDVEVWLTDRSVDAVTVARANIAGLGRNGSRVRVAEGDWFEALPSELAGRFDVIVSNPPYVSPDDEIESQVADWEPAEALFADGDGTGHLRHLIAGAGSWLVDDGALVLEMAPWQVPAMTELSGRHFAQVESVVDLAGRDRGLIARHPLRR